MRVGSMYKRYLLVRRLLHEVLVIFTNHIRDYTKRIFCKIHRTLPSWNENSRPKIFIGFAIIWNTNRVSFSCSVLQAIGFEVDYCLRISIFHGKCLKRYSFQEEGITFVNWSSSLWNHSSPTIFSSYSIRKMGYFEKYILFLKNKKPCYDTSTIE